MTIESKQIGHCCLSLAYEGVADAKGDLGLVRQSHAWGRRHDDR